MPFIRIRYDQIGVISIIDEAANAIRNWWQPTNGSTSSNPLNRPMTIRSLDIKSFDWEATPAANHRCRNEKRLRSETINGKSHTFCNCSIRPFGLTILFVSAFWRSSLLACHCRAADNEQKWVATGCTPKAIWTTIETRNGWETQTQVLFTAARRHPAG